MSRECVFIISFLYRRYVILKITVSESSQHAIAFFFFSMLHRIYGIFEKNNCELSLTASDSYRQHETVFSLVFCIIDTEYFKKQQFSLTLEQH